MQVHSLLKYAGAAVLLAGTMLMASEAALAQKQHGNRSFNPHVRAPTPYDPSAVSIAGSSGCHWTREQTFVQGKLVWRPLLQCYYGW